MQICKLHDPAIQRDSINITIDYIVRFGDWGRDKRKVNRIVTRLNTLFEKIKPARHKVICHNDLKTLMDNKATSGAFPDGLDKKYFLALHELVDKVLEKLTDESPPFVSFADTGRFAVDDVNEFLDGIEKT